MRSANITGDGRRRDHFRTREIAFRIPRTHAAFEVSIRRRDPDLARLKQSHAEANARPAARRQRLRARIQQSLPDATLLGFYLHPLTGRAQIELHARGNFLTFEYFGRGLQIFQPRIYARDQICLLDRNFILLNCSQRLHRLYGIGPRHVRRDLPEVERNARRVNSIGIRRGWILLPTMNVLL